jgi:hypothetical protein
MKHHDYMFRVFSYRSQGIGCDKIVPLSATPATGNLQRGRGASVEEDQKIRSRSVPCVHVSMCLCVCVRSRCWSSDSDDEESSFHTENRKSSLRYE